MSRSPALYPFAVAVAEHISAARGVTWAARRPKEEHDHYVEVLRFDGAALSFANWANRSTRVMVKARWPKDCEPWEYKERPVTPAEARRGVVRHSSNERVELHAEVALSRDPRLAAGHILRRIFDEGEYEARWTVAARKAARNAAEDREDDAFLDALAELGADRRDDGRAIVGGLSVSVHAERGECEVRGTMPRDLLLRIAGEMMGTKERVA